MEDNTENQRLPRKITMNEDDMKKLLDKIEKETGVNKEEKISERSNTEDKEKDINKKPLRIFKPTHPKKSIFFKYKNNQDNQNNI